MGRSLLLIGALALALATVALAGPRGPMRIKRARTYVSAFFEFLSAGTTAGQTQPCDGQLPTGVKGEVLTFTRASTAYCDKSNGLTGIVPGDLVELSANQPRLSKVGGTTLKLGLFEERTNLVPYSSGGNGWTPSGNIVVQNTSNIGGPDGTTAARSYGDACPSSDNKAFRSPGAVTAGSASGYFLGCISETDGGCIQVSSTAAADGGPMRADGGAAIGLDGGRGVGVVQVGRLALGVAAVSYNAITWTRGVRENGGGNTVVYGCINDSVNFPGATNTGDFDVVVWGMQSEEGATVSPPIRTVGTAATRVAEVATMPYTASGASRSLAVSVLPPSTFTAGRTALQLYFDASNDTRLYETSTAATSAVTSDFRIAGSSSTKATTATMTASTSARLAAYYSASVRAACLDGTCLTAAGALTLPSGAATVRLGGSAAGAGFEINGWISQVCIDPDPTRCRL